MSIEVFRIFLLSSAASIILPLIFYLKRATQLPLANHIVGSYVIATAILDTIVTVLFLQKKSTVLIVNMYYLSAFAFFAFYYFHLLFKERQKVVLYSGVVIYLTAYLYIFGQSIGEQYQNYLWALEGAVISIFAITYIVALPKMVIHRLLDKNFYSYQIVNTSVLFYFLVTLLLFVSTDYVLQNADGDTRRLFWSFHNIANALKNIGLAIGLYYTGRRDVKTTLLEIERIGRERSGEAHDPLWTNTLKK